MILQPNTTINETEACVLLKEERRNMILSLMREYKSISSVELSKKLNVTQETIRKDLNYLDKNGLLKRTFGGAMPIPSTDDGFDIQDPSFELRKISNFKEKDAIGKFAASLIEPKDTIVLDASTTTLQMVKYIPEDMDIVVITNAFSVLCELVKKEGVSIISVGGYYRKSSTSFLGSITLKALESYNINKAFLSGNSVSVEKGLMDPIEQEADFKRKMVEVAEKSILLAGHSKFGRIAPFSDCQITAFDTVVSDINLSDEIVKKLENLSIKVYRA